MAIKHVNIGMWNKNTDVSRRHLLSDYNETAVSLNLMVCALDTLLKFEGTGNLIHIYIAIIIASMA